MPPVPEFGSMSRNRFLGQEPAVLFPEADHCAFSPAMMRSASRDGISFAGDQDRADDQLGFDTGSNFTRSFELHEVPSFWKDNNVQVIIRIRPLNSSEISLHGHRRCVIQDGPQVLTWVGQPQARFTFDIVADENVTQEKLFKVAGVPMVENCMGGYNSCMFAYGQTGSGKTHTMLGDIEGGTRRHNVNCGMTPRVFEYLFSRIQKEKEARMDEKLKFTCRCSFLEIYNEHILDLLEPSSSNLQIREDARKGVYVENITEFEVSSAHDVMHRLLQGASNRKVAATNMNHASSRSHSVFTCAIESKWEIQGVTHHRFARLNLVDLAGSERQKSSGAEGDRLKEATNINKSLSTLGLVIMNLVNISNGKPQHVPYRDSKLTFLLQDSLGGNSKTIIIANISPSNCCSLETLSTLKFAQRAKFIRNNAIVNEDALGDVFAMRLQIQQLKKEVNRLRALANGGSDHQEVDSSSVCFPGSPGAFTWDVLQGPLVPLTSDEKIFKKRDLEAAMVAAIRREQDKEASLKALTKQHQATLQLAKQREAEIQSLKMRLRFREAGIKRLEALASSKITAGEHLLQEKMELMKEIDVLRGQVDRNLEVTRFAMENLTLKEELKKFQSFYDGEREMLVEQVDLLQDKLAEALEWKLMHEKAMDKVQDISSDMDYSFISDENEVLQVQAIQYQRELEAVRKNLKACLDVNEKLERRVGDLVLELEKETKVTANVKEAIKGHTYDPGFPSTTDPCISVRSDPVELKAMVDAIAAASQREAQAHETSIFLEKENIELRKKVKVLLEDNAKLIKMYEGAVSVDVNDPKMTNIDSNCDQTLFDNANMGIPLEDTDDLQMKNVKFLEQQLQEMHEENDKLMGLYEKAMQERDDLKRMLQDAQINHNAVGESTEDSLRNAEPIMIPAKAETSGEELKMALKKLDLSVELLFRVSKAVNMMDISSCDIENFLNEIETSEAYIWMKEQEIALLNLVYSETGNMKSRVDDRLHAFKDYTLKLSETSESLDQRETQARAIADELSCLVNQKQKRAFELQTQGENLKSAHSEAQKHEISTTNIIANLRSRLEVSETQRKETENALFADCTNRPGLSMEGMQSLQLGKAAELLKSEEERIKLSAELKDAEGKLKQIRKEARLLKTQYEALDVEFKSIKMELTLAKSSLADAGLDLSNLISEGERVMQLREAALEELQFLILDYQTVTFELDSKLEERMVFEEELQAQLTSLQELEHEKVAAMKKISQLLGDKIKIEEALRDAQKVLFEAKASLISHLASLSL